MSVLVCLAVFVFVSSGSSQSRHKPSSAVPTQGMTDDIRQVDFLNYTYHSSLCSQEIGQGIGKTVRVRKGEFKNADVYFGVVDKHVIYGDVTGDGREDAVVHIGCGENLANFGLDELSVYITQSRRPTLLAQINGKDVELDYRRNYSDAETLWGIANNGVRIRNGNVEIDALADGIHAAPRYLVTFRYAFSRNTISLNGKPQRRVFK